MLWPHVIVSSIIVAVVTHRTAALAIVYARAISFFANDCTPLTSSITSLTTSVTHACSSRCLAVDT